MSVRVAIGPVIVGMLVLCLASDVPAHVRNLGRNVEVGAFRVHTQVVQQRVVLEEIGGNNAATVPVTSLAAAFSGWDPVSRTAAVGMAVQNVGDSALFGPIRVVITKLASPFTRPTNVDEGDGLGSWSWVYPVNQIGPGDATASRVWRLVSPTAQDFQFEVRVYAGVPLPAGKGATIAAQDGSTITVEPDSLPYDALVDIATVPVQVVEAPLGNLQAVAAFEVIFEPAAYPAELPPPSTSFAVSLPFSTSSETRDFLVTQQLRADAFDGRQAPEFSPRLLTRAVATRAGEALVSGDGPFAGIQEGGLYVVIPTPVVANGYASGLALRSGQPRPGVVVSNDQTPLIAVTNGAGEYTIPLPGASAFTLTGFDPLWGHAGSATGFVNPTATAYVNIDLSEDGVFPLYPSRPGVRNGGFERGLDGWQHVGAVEARDQFSLVDPVGAVVHPDEADVLVDVHTGPGSVAGGSLLSQSIKVPFGAKILRFAYNVLTENWAGAGLGGDVFRATAIFLGPGTSGEEPIVEVSTDDPSAFSPLGICGFSGETVPCWATGWREASIDLSAFAGVSTVIQLNLAVSPQAGTRASGQTHVLVDNFRFRTLYLDVNTVIGAAHALPKIKDDVRGANDLLALAGINVQVRGWKRDLILQTPPGSPWTFLDLDLATASDYGCTLALGCGLFATDEMTALLKQARSTVASDLQLYHVRSFSVATTAGHAVGPDDYVTLGGLNWGIILADPAGGATLAHEIGHILISPDNAGSSLEHKASEPSNFMKSPRTLPATWVSATQSKVMHSGGQTYLLP